MVIDCHAHRYPPAVFANPAAFANSRGEKHWQNLVVPEKGPTIQGWADRETMLADMDSGGVDKAVLLGWYWETPETCALHNRWHGEWIRK
ncbi:MAG: amidohydrolase, partial [Verrucomicrobia bacterium]|nr:amidohydrolase [Verrucomicrobiota bacterium]